MKDIEERIELLKIELRVETAYLEKANIDIKSALDSQYIKCLGLQNDIRQLIIRRNHIKSLRQNRMKSI